MKYDFALDLYGKNSLAKIIAEIKPHTTVLEFGPANGRMTKYLKENLHCKVYAVEIDAEAAAYAAPYAEKMVVDDIETFHWLEAFAGVVFDYVIFADVLEHLYDPRKVLQAVQGVLQDNGKILLSVPNIAHNSILIDLFQNRFSYTPIGLLDNTHIRFFTYTSLQQLFYELELVPVLEDAIYAEVGMNEIRNTYDELDDGVAYWLRQRFCGQVYQFVFALQKKLDRTEFGLVKKIKSTYPFPCWLEVFVDTGGGFHGQEKLQFDWRQEGEHCFTFDLAGFSDVQQVRIDPANMPLLMRVASLVFFYPDGTEKVVDDFYCNADYQVDETYVFLHDDAQICFAPGQCCGVEKITFKADLFYVQPGRPYLQKDGLLYRGIETLQRSKEILQQENDALREANERLQDVGRQWQEAQKQWQEEQKRWQEERRQLEEENKQLQIPKWRKIARRLKNKYQ